MKRASYSNVMSTLALFVALGGGAYAVTIGRNDVGAREIAPNSVGSSELKTNGVRGIDVRESTLRRVPRAFRANRAALADEATRAALADEATHAAAADSAVTAQNSTTVGGVTVRKFNVRQTTGDPLEPVLDLAGLHLQMSCLAGGDLIATTSKDNSSIFVWGVYTGIHTIGSEDLEGADFNLNETFDVNDNMGGGSFSPDLGTLLYENSDGTVVAVDLVVDFNPGPGPDDDCGVAGIAVGG